MQNYLFRNHKIPTCYLLKSDLFVEINVICNCCKVLLSALGRHDGKVYETLYEVTTSIFRAEIGEDRIKQYK
jgi:hypothetical protein